MNSRIKPAALIVGATIVALAGFSAISFAQAPKKAAPVTYKQVQTIFDAKCTKCHHGAEPPAKMNLETYVGVTKGNDHGPVVSAGHPEKSLLYQVITATGKKLMPPKSPLPKADIALIQAWIKGGAKGK